MAAAKKSEAKPAEEPAEVVLVPFAYATAKGGEVVQLVKGDTITDRYEAASIEHLRSIGFVAESD